MKLIIVSSFNDLKYVKNLGINKILVSGFTSVSNFFNKKKLYCYDLNKFHTNESKKKNFLKLQKEYYDIFHNKELCYLLFRNKYLFHFIGLNYLKDIVSKIIKDNNINEIILMGSIKNKLDSDPLIYEILIGILKNFKIKINIIDKNKDSMQNQKKNLISKVKNLINEIIIKSEFKISQKENIFLFEKNKLGRKKLKLYLKDNYNLYDYYQINQFSNINLTKIKYNIKNSSSFVKIFLKRYFKEFIKLNKKVINFEKKEFLKLIKKKNIKKIAWFFSPCEVNMFPILIRECFKKNISVLGFQHGGTYGAFNERNPNTLLNYVNDYEFCNIFHSYSKFKIINKKKIFFKKQKTEVKQINFFDNKNIQTQQNKILYVPQIINNFFYPKFSPNSLDFYNKQKEIVDVLNSNNLKNREILIKTYNDLSEDFIEKYYPIYPYVSFIKNNKKNFKISKAKDLIELVQKEKPGTIILDYISTPLWEIIKFPVNILILKDNNFYFLNKKMLNNISFKVKFFKNGKELLNEIFKNNNKTMKISNKAKLKKFIL